MSILPANFHVRVAVLSLLAIGAVAAAVAALYGHPVPVAALFLTAASLAAGGAISYLHLRHGALAVLVALSPLPGLFAAGLAPLRVPLSGPIAADGLGVLVAAYCAGSIVRSLIDGADAVAASRRCAVDLALPLAVGGAATGLLEVGWLFHETLAEGLAEGLAAFSATVSSFLFVVFGASVLPFGEGFFTAANRARERRERWLRLAAVLGEPRWGLSLTGVAMVLGVLGWFGAAPLLAHKAELLRHSVWAACALGAFLVVLAVGRDWRAAVGAIFALVMLTLLSLWLWGWTVGHPAPVTLLEIAIVDGAALMGMLLIADGARRFRKAGDAASVARSRALEFLGASSWLAPAGAAAAIVPWTIVHGSLATLAVLFLMSGVTAAVIAPAITTTLETIIPRRRSVRELYGRG